MNADLLKYVIARQHFTMQDIANKLSFTRQALYTRLDGKVEFKLSEIRALSEILALSEQEIQDIFFK